MRFPPILLVALLGAPACDDEPSPDPADDDDVAVTDDDDDSAAPGDDDSAVEPSSPFALSGLWVSCGPSPDEGAPWRWEFVLETTGWASLSRGVRLFLWDGTTGDEAWIDAHQPFELALAGHSAEPLAWDRWELSLPGFDDAAAAATAQGTAVACRGDHGLPLAAEHSYMVCATDTRDLSSVLCALCGDPSRSAGALGAVGDFTGAAGSWHASTRLDCRFP